MSATDKIRVTLSALLEILLAVNIIIAVASQTVSVSAFVCTALIAMSQIGTNLLNDHYNRKNSNEE